VVLPDSVTRIGKAAFAYCVKLKSINIPEAVKYIGDAAFYKCEKLVDDKGFVIVKGMVHFYNGDETEVVLPDNVTSIGSLAFSFRDKIKSIYIPDGVKYIGSRAFMCCDGLADEEGFIIIRNVLYGYCGSKLNITIPSQVNEIGSGAFERNKDMESIIIPDGVTRIGKCAFFGCAKLKSLKLPEGLELIGSYAFVRCVGLENMNLPDSVVAIGDKAFQSCDNLVIHTSRKNYRD
jgi:hypothetical protein